ncbi:MAG: hypothetical protein C0506_09715 [Anaerolinea sp.]|nr:hypothetical protein [Anaerolinea sp.]
MTVAGVAVGVAGRGVAVGGTDVGVAGRAVAVGRVGGCVAGRGVAVGAVGTSAATGGDAAAVAAVAAVLVAAAGDASGDVGEGVATAPEPPAVVGEALLTGSEARDTARAGSLLSKAPAKYAAPSAPNAIVTAAIAWLAQDGAGRFARLAVAAATGRDAPHVAQKSAPATVTGCPSAQVAVAPQPSQNLAPAARVLPHAGQAGSGSPVSTRFAPVGLGRRGDYAGELTPWLY